MDVTISFFVEICGHSIIKEDDSEGQHFVGVTMQWRCPRQFPKVLAGHRPYCAGDGSGILFIWFAIRP